MEMAPDHFGKEVLRNISRLQTGWSLFKDRLEQLAAEHYPALDTIPLTEQQMEYCQDTN